MLGATCCARICDVQVAMPSLPRSAATLVIRGPLTLAPHPASPSLKSKLTQPLSRHERRVLASMRSTRVSAKSGRPQLWRSGHWASLPCSRERRRERAGTDRRLGDCCALAQPPLLAAASTETGGSADPFCPAVTIQRGALPQAPSFLLLGSARFRNLTPELHVVEPRLLRLNGETDEASFARPTTG